MRKKMITAMILGITVAFSSASTPITNDVNVVHAADYDYGNYDYGDYDYSDYDYDDYDYGDYDDYDYDDYDDDDYYDSDDGWSGSVSYSDRTPVTKRTQKQIKSYLKKNKISYSAKTKYTTKPKTKAPYKAGVVLKTTLKSALKLMNAIRYIAGLNDDVKLDDEYNKLAQAAALCNAANNTLSHYPDKPKSMSDSLYELGEEGASSSNIGMGYDSLNSALINGWMSDEDSSNIDRIGHRRWVLNPEMGKTGFGIVGSYTAMYCFDESGSGHQKNVYWPAQNTPLSFFDNNDPWSVSTGQSVDASKVKVVLTRASDGKKWTFSSKSKKAGYFNVNNDGYGLSGCIIFRPKNIKYKAKDKFNVVITGVPGGDIKYSVVFFKA